ncbi:MAG: hypothetical protein R3F60_26890 [bacterium]
MAALRAGVRPAFWQVARERGEVVLAAWLVDDAVSRYEAAVGGRPGGSTAALAEALAAETAPHDLVALRAGPRAAMAAFAEGLRGARIYDIRPEGATVHGRRGKPDQPLDAGWAGLAEAVHRALEEAP